MSGVIAGETKAVCLQLFADAEVHDLEELLEDAWHLHGRAGSSSAGSSLAVEKPSRSQQQSPSLQRGSRTAADSTSSNLRSYNDNIKPTMKGQRWFR